MGQFFTDKTEEGIRLIWMQYDTEKAVEGKRLLQQAAEEGEADAYSFLSRAYMGVKGLPEDSDKAFELLRKSVELGSACGILTMLQYRKLSKEITKHKEPAELQQAAAEVQKKAEDGHAYCQLIMGMYYFWGGYWTANGLSIDEEYPDEDKALDARTQGAEPWFEKALYGGLTVALANLYDIYEAYPEKEEKLEKAIRFAAEYGDPYWQVRLANWLFEQEKYEESLARFEQLAQDGYARAWYDIGFQYERGIGTPIDNSKAIASYEQGAKQGSSDCQTRYGKQLLWGELVPADDAQAYFWFCKGAEQGDEVAKMFKGHCLFYGIGVVKDVSEATNYLVDALNFNYPGAGSSQAMAEQSQFDWQEDMMQLFWDLGDAYESGKGMPKRESSAGYYFSMVAEGGWPEAVEKMTHYKQSGLFKKWKRIS